VSDNGTQFASQQLGKLFTELDIRQVFASIEHPQTNGQVEFAKRVLLRGLKRRLEKAKGTWQMRFLELYGLTTPLPNPPPSRHLLAWCMGQML